jgi:hypothetical protein
VRWIRSHLVQRLPEDLHFVLGGRRLDHLIDRDGPLAVPEHVEVPMGADLPAPPEGATAPSFLVFALRDVISGNLDRIQIVKGWLDHGGKTHEKVYDVAWSGDRRPGADGKLPAVGNSVDTKTASWANTIGAPELATVWTDPDFDPAESAFYYARVLEIPTPPWYAYDALRFGVEIPKDAPTSQQERAYTSPIWYKPHQ